MGEEKGARTHAGAETGGAGGARVQGRDCGQSPLLNAPVETWTLGLGNAVAGSALRRQGHRVAAGWASASRAQQFAHLAPPVASAASSATSPAGAVSRQVTSPRTRSSALGHWKSTWLHLLSSKPPIHAKARASLGRVGSGVKLDAVVRVLVRPGSECWNLGQEGQLAHPGLPVLLGCRAAPGQSCRGRPTAGVCPDCKDRRRY